MTRVGLGTREQLPPSSMSSAVIHDGEELAPPVALAARFCSPLCFVLHPFPLRTTRGADTSESADSTAADSTDRRWALGEYGAPFLLPVPSRRLVAKAALELRRRWGARERKKQSRQRPRGLCFLAARVAAHFASPFCSSSHAWHRHAALFLFRWQTHLSSRGRMVHSGLAKRAHPS